MNSSRCVPLNTNSEVERLVRENGDQVGEPVHHILPAAELVGIVEVCISDSFARRKNRLLAKQLQAHNSPEIALA